MSSPRSRIAIVAAAATVALAASGCGSSDKGLLTARQANRLESPLERARRAVEAGDCADARREAQTGSERAAALSSRVDSELQRNLQDGFNRLVDRINAEVVVAGQADRAVALGELDAGVRLGAVADQVAEAPDLVHARLVGRGQHGAEGRAVAVDVGGDRDAHR